MTRAYLRLDPKFWERKRIEQGYPAGAVSALVGVFCLAEHQPERGRFRNERVLKALLSDDARWLPYLKERGDVVIDEDLSVYVDGWEEWQEGDIQVNERVRRIRARHGAVRSSGAERTAAWRRRKAEEAQRGRVTDGVTSDVTTRDGRDASPALDSESVIDGGGVAISSAEERSAGGASVTLAGDDVFGIVHLVEELTNRPWTFAPGNRVIEHIRYDVRDYGPEKVAAAVGAAAAAGEIHDPNVLAMDAHKALNPHSRANGAAPKKPKGYQPSDEEVRRAFDAD